MGDVAGAAFMKVAEVAKGAGMLQSLWKTGGFPGAGSTPPSGSGAAPDNTEPGAQQLASAEGRIFGACGGAVPGTLIVYDRLVHSSGLVGNTGSSQPVNSVPITRPDANGVGAELWLEVYTPTGSTPQNVQATYTNSLGTGSRVTRAISLIATPAAGQLFMLPLQDGDLGVRSVQAVQLAGSTGTAGDFGIVIARRLALGPIVVSDLPVQFAGRRPLVYSTSCVALAVLASTTDTGFILGELGLL